MILKRPPKFKNCTIVKMVMMILTCKKEWLKIKSILHQELIKQSRKEIIRFKKKAAKTLNFLMMSNQKGNCKDLKDLLKKVNQLIKIVIFLVKIILISQKMLWWVVIIKKGKEIKEIDKKVKRHIRWLIQKIINLSKINLNKIMTLISKWVMIKNRN